MREVGCKKCHAENQMLKWRIVWVMENYFEQGGEIGPLRWWHELWDWGSVTMFLFFLWLWETWRTRASAFGHLALWTTSAGRWASLKPGFHSLSTGVVLPTTPPHQPIGLPLQTVWYGFLNFLGSQISWMSESLGVSQDPHCWAPPPEFLIQVGLRIFISTKCWFASSSGDAWI